MVTISPWISHLLDVICHCSSTGRKLTYIVYQIWLSRNNFVFDAEMVLAVRVLEKACELTGEYRCFDAVG